MDTAIRQFNSNSSTLIWAMVCSILLHVLLAVFIPKLHFDPVETPKPLTIELVQKPEPVPEVAPAPEPQPAPPEPEPTPVKPQPIPKPTPTPVVKPQPTPVPIKEEPSPVAPPPAQPEVIAVAPKPDAPPAPVVVPPPPKPVGPTQAEIDDANSNYGDTLWGAIGRHKKYPRIAQQRGWQGEVVVELSLDGNGKLRSKRILQSSGYESLDNQAMEMVEKALPFPQPPEALRGSNFTIKVPIPFKLE